MSKARELASLGNAYSDGALSNRNLIINGAMQVAQRGTVANASNSYSVDRWNLYTNTAARFTLGQDADVPVGQGFANSVKIDVTTAETAVSTNGFCAIRQPIEGQNLQSLCKGTPNAKEVTLQFWIKSTVTGTYAIELYDYDNVRQVTKTYTIDAADTWEKKVMSFPADTVGAFVSDNTTGMYLQFGLLMGSDFNSGTATGVWGASVNANRFAGQVNAASSTANNIYITGVQLEVGDTATPFEHRSYGQELALCQRYYWARLSGRTVYAGDYGANCFGQFFFPVTMRASPAVTATTNKTVLATYHSQELIQIYMSGNAGAISSSSDFNADAEL